MDERFIACPRYLLFSHEWLKAGRHFFTKKRPGNAKGRPEEKGQRQRRSTSTTYYSWSDADGWTLSPHIPIARDLTQGQREVDRDDLSVHVSAAPFHQAEPPRGPGGGPGEPGQGGAQAAAQGHTPVRGATL